MQNILFYLILNWWQNVFFILFFEISFLFKYDKWLLWKLINKIKMNERQKKRHIKKSKGKVKLWFWLSSNAS